MPFVLDVRPPSEFSYEVAKSKLTNLKFGQDDDARFAFVVPGDTIAAEGYEDEDSVIGRHGQLLRLAGWVDLESRLTVSHKTTIILRTILTPLRLAVSGRCFPTYNVGVQMPICLATTLRT